MYTNRWVIIKGYCVLRELILGVIWMSVSSVDAKARLNLLAVEEGQREQWDAFVSRHPQGHLMQSWGWGELKAASGWSPVHIALYNEEREIEAAALVLCRTAAHVPLWAGHLAYIPKGPVLDWQNKRVSEAF